MTLTGPADALRHLLARGGETGKTRCWVSDSSSCMGTAANGMEHYWVEVTCIDGKQYQISAFGAEARELSAESGRNLGLGNFVEVRLGLPEFVRD